jgi:hypothetical protein
MPYSILGQKLPTSLLLEFSDSTLSSSGNKKARKSTNMFKKDKSQNKIFTDKEYSDQPVKKKYLKKKRYRYTCSKLLHAETKN